ncbi:Phytanoyl-CoA dioxygenase (PhyH) [Seminavis robusta]|uniref:Phytanoyl-CoA dioxygenase (PhyH) n=1 Tax=Seminavis robusta TaxID=568900 RepID=A0A9N8EZY8_9STRA|nr:Phytanoyl-CoA dioxygenase (PhyH) [Seminavis robusta]|eukprot:Sro3301_g346430.1 Phytanoyl-CoA dioxygenase (PhyH) (309) ;mRNA; r:3417-4343
MKPPPTTEASPRDNDDDDDPAKQLFARDGFLVLRNALSKDLLSEWQQFASDYFEQCFEELHQRGHTPFPCHYNGETYALGLGVKHGFREIVMRSPGRYELSLLHCQEKAPSIRQFQSRLSVIPKLLSGDDVDTNNTTKSCWDDLSLCHLSLVVSTPGASEQSWHADGGHVSTSQHLPCHVANLFIPLAPVSLDLGPTEFRPGSHVYTRNLAPLLLAAKARKELRPPVAPLLDEGDVLVFDYRVLHRGKANTTHDTNRPILVLTFSQPWYKDVCNFPKNSLYDPPTTTEETTTTTATESQEKESKNAGA